jgi:cell division protein FtsL
MNTCKNCNEPLFDKNKKAIFCSTSCRVSYHQKQKRLQEKKPLKRFPIWIKKNISKAAVWFFLIILLIFSIPYVFNKGMRIYTDYRVEWQNEKLIQLEQQIEELSNKPRLLEENKRLKYHLKTLFDIELGWMDKESVEQYKRKVLKSDNKLLGD